MNPNKLVEKYRRIDENSLDKLKDLERERT